MINFSKQIQREREREREREERERERDGQTGSIIETS
jgi:hypothetical protein